MSAEFYMTFDEGADVRFVPQATEPLGCEDLRKLERNKNADLEVRITAQDVHIDGIHQPGHANIQMKVQFGSAPVVMALVRGGWVPTLLAKPNRFLVDRNVVLSLRKIREGGRRQHDKSVQWWAHLMELNGPVLLNPLPYAYESAKQRKPTYQEFANSYDEARLELQAAIPDCQVVAFHREHYLAAYSQLEAFEVRAEAELQFLMTISPIIAQRVSSAERATVSKKILGTANQLKLAKSSLVVLASLSCLYEVQDGPSKSIGRKILKPKLNYRSQDAFNAICDLRNIEISAANQALFGREAFSLCTCDIGLAMLWSALSLDGTFHSDSELEFTFNLNSELLQTLASEEILELREQIR